MKLDTERLEIIPLTLSQLLKYLKSDNSLESELGLEANPRFVPSELVEAITQTILPTVADEDNNYLFSTIWTIVLKEKNVMVGDLCFKGEPNGLGEIEIGYGIYESFQGNGYMTEAIKTISEWAFTQEGVDSIIAETDNDNIPSHRVLEKNGFQQDKSIEGMLWWRLNKKTFAE